MSICWSKRTFAASDRSEKVSSCFACHCCIEKTIEQTPAIEFLIIGSNTVMCRPFCFCGSNCDSCFPKLCAFAMTWDLGWVVCVTATRLVRTTMFDYFTPVSEVDPKP